MQRIIEPGQKDQLAVRISRASAELVGMLDRTIVGIPFGEGGSSLCGVPADPGMYIHELIDKAVEVRLFQPPGQISSSRA